MSTHEESPPKPHALTPKQVAACVEGLTEKVARVLMARQIIPSYPVGRRDYRTLDSWLDEWKRTPRDLSTLLASVHVEEHEEKPSSNESPKHYSQYALRSTSTTRSKAR